MNIEMRDGRQLMGTPKQIVRAMQDLAFGVDDFTVAKYVAWVVDNALRFESVALKVEGETDEALCESLVDEMVRTGLARKL